MSFYLPLILFCFSTSITPGPNNLMLLMSGINFGLKRSLPHTLGICCGFFGVVFLVGIGLSEIFIKFPLLHQAIKYLGALYMLYLAGKIIASTTELQSAKAGHKPITFIKAVLFQWVNPKGLLMAIGVVSTYTLPNQNIIAQSFIISAIFFIVLVPCLGFWLIGGVAIAKYITQPKYLRCLNISMGGLLLASIFLMLASK